MPDERHDMVVKQEEPSNPIPFAKNEETQDNPGEGETPEEAPVEETPVNPEEAPVSEQVTEENKPETVKEEMVSKKELDKLYARTKKAEEDAKKAKNQLAEQKSVSEVDTILEVQKATKGLDADEVAELQLRAKAKEVSLSEAREDENFKLWREGKKAKVEKEKALNPSTAQPGAAPKKPLTTEERLKAAKTLEEEEEILNEATYLNPMTGRSEKGINPLKKLQDRPPGRISKVGRV